MLYGKFKLMGGYITTCPGGLAIHASEKRAILLKYRDMEKQRKNFSFCDLFTCKKVRLCIRTGPEYLLPVYTFSLVKNVVERITAREILDGEFWLEAGDELRIAAELILSFTIGKQLKALLKYLFGRIKKKWKMKKSTA